MLAVQQRQGARVIAVHAKQVERKIGEVFCAAFLKGCLQVSEVGYAVFIESNNFAIDDRILDGQLCGRGGDLRHPCCPVQAFSCKERGFSLTILLREDVNLNAVAVKLEFMNPATGIGRFQRLPSQLRFDESWE